MILLTAVDVKALFIPVNMRGREVSVKQLETNFSKLTSHLISPSVS